MWRYSTFGIRSLVLCCICLGLCRGASGETLHWNVAPPATGDWFTASNWTPNVVPSSANQVFIDNQGTALITSGSATAGLLYLGHSAFGNLVQSGGTLSLTTVTVNSTSRYELAGGTLHVGDRFDLLGHLDFASSFGTVNLAANGTLDWSRGTMTNASNVTISGGAGSTIFLPIGLNPYTFFGSFTTQGDVFNVSGPLLVVPAGFVMNATTDRVDRMRIEGTLRSRDEFGNWQHFTISQGGIEVAPGGLFEVGTSSIWRNLSVHSDSAIAGGNLTVNGTMTVGTTNRPTVFTQTGGTVNAGAHSSQHLTLRNSSQYVQSGGSLSTVGNLVMQDGSRYTVSGGTASIGREMIVNAAGDVFR